MSVTMGHLQRNSDTGHLLWHVSGGHLMNVCCCSTGPADSKGTITRSGIVGQATLVFNATPPSEPYGAGDYWSGAVSFWGGTMNVWASLADPAIGKVEWGGAVGDVAITYSAGAPIVANFLLYTSGGGNQYYAKVGPSVW